MIDLIYKFNEWIVEFIVQFPVPNVDEIIKNTVIDPITGLETIVEEIVTKPSYEIAIYNNTTIIIYLLWTILIIVFIALIIWLFKTIAYAISSVLY